MAGVCITHCVCHGVPFSHLRDLAQDRGWTLEDVMAQTGCGTECGLCRPYLRVMLADGTTEFHSLLPPDDSSKELPES